MYCEETDETCDWLPQGGLGYASGDLADTVTCRIVGIGDDDSITVSGGLDPAQCIVGVADRPGKHCSRQPQYGCNCEESK